MSYENWGRYPNPPQQAVRMTWRDELLPKGPLLAYGNGRSQGDVCLNSVGTLLDMRGLDRLVAFDRNSGLLTAEAGILLDDILQITMPQGWMLPVVPGTRFITLGGAIANDVHGKNHHQAGSFGHWVKGFTLRRSDETTRDCVAGDVWFKATVGGMGLTGIITQATVQLVPVLGSQLQRQVFDLKGLEDFFAHSDATQANCDYSVAWLDLTAPFAKLGRGYLEVANWGDAHGALHAPPAVKWSVPLRPPVSMINKLSVRIFNELWLRKPRRSGLVNYAAFLWPLDGVGEWKRLYGPRKFIQCQLVVPRAAAPQTLLKILQLVRTKGNPSFLNTLKLMGNQAAVGMLSFARPGVTLALDMSYEGHRTNRLFFEIERLVMEAGGGFYPAKDALMSGAAFKKAYPQWMEFLGYRDPQMSSDWWRRVMESKSI